MDSKHETHQAKIIHPNWRSIYSEITMRTPTHKDIPAILNLGNSETEFYFGTDNKIEVLLETALVSKVLVNKSNQIFAFVCFESYPLVPALDDSCWAIWLKKHFNIHDFQGVLFVRYLVFDPQVDSEMLRKVFHEVFLIFRATTYIVFLEPPMNDKQNESFFLYRNIIQYWSPPHFSCIVPADVPHLKIYKLRCDNFLLSLKCRIATAEDNDILVNLLNKKYPGLKKKYGEFHVAEQILKKDPNKKYILMERNDEVFGVMLINRIVDLDYLNKNFDLSLCNHLKRVEENPKKKLLIAKDVLLRKTSDFFNTNYFKLKPKLFESRSAVRRKQGLEDVDSDDSMLLKRENSLQMSLSFDAHSPSSSESSDSDKHKSKLPRKKHSSEIIRPFCSYIGKDLADNIPNSIFTEKEILIPDGKSNAFLVELFASNIDERRLFELLKAAFSLCNQKCYCITLVKPGHLQQCLLNYFTFLPKRIESECELGLYIAHRNTVLKSVNITEATIDDIRDIEIFLKINDPERCSASGEIYKTFIESVTSYRHDYKSVVIRTSGSLIGLVILQTENRLHKLRKYFDLDSLYKYEYVMDPQLHGRIIYLFLLPLFNNVYRLIFRHICLITGYKFLYYGIDDIENLKIYNNLIGKMCAVAPNSVCDIYDENSIEHRFFSKDHDTLKSDMIFPLFHQNIKINGRFFQSIDTRIICVGFDDTCKGFLKKLLFDKKYSYRIFENITIITQPGDYECQTTRIYDWIRKLLNVRYYNSPDYLNRMGLRIWVNFINGKVAAIDRKMKIVYLRDYRKIKYDYLILTCSIKFGFPRGSKWSHIGQPSNYESINSPMEAALFSHKLALLMETFSKGFNIVVYGCSLHAYSCINYLLEKGVPGEYINFVILQQTQCDDLNLPAFRDKCIESLILKELENHNVKIYNGYHFANWEFEENSRMIKKITFSSRFHIITLKCRLFVCYNTKVLKRAFRFIFQRSGLLMDGRLVIDDNYKLNDPYIFAAGPITQYKRLLFAKKFDHYYFDSFEVGESLCDKFMENLLNVPLEKRIDRIPNFKRPKVEQAYLPGGYLYISIIKSGYVLPIQISTLFQAKHGTNLIWENFNNDKTEINTKEWTSDFFRFRYYSDGTFRTMVCLTKKTDSKLDFLAEIFQRNIKLLHIHERFKNGLTTDPLTYFSKVWTSAIVYPKFVEECSDKNMQMMINYLLKHSSTEKIIKPYLKARRKLSLSENERKSIVNCLQTDNLTRNIEFNLIKFINQNYNHLFMYLKCNTDESYFSKCFKEKNENCEDE